MKHSGMLIARQRKFTVVLEWTYQANDPMRLTNLSSSLLPAQLIREQKTTVAARKTFFCHFIEELCFPDRENMPFSMIRTAGKSWRGMERRMATESTGSQYQLLVSTSHSLGARKDGSCTYRGTVQPGQTCRPAAD